MAASRYFLVRLLSVFFLVQAVCLYVPQERLDAALGLATVCQQDSDDRLDFGAQQRELTSRYIIGWRSQTSQQQHPKPVPDRIGVNEGVAAYGLPRPDGYSPPFEALTSPPPIAVRA